MTHQPYSALPSPIHDSVGNTLTSLADWEIPGNTAINYHQQQFLAAQAPQWLRQGLAHLRQGQYTSSLALLQQALEAYRSLGDHEREAKVLLVLATLYYRVADYLWATDYGRQCLKVAQAIQHTELTQRALEHLGNSYRHLKDYTKALEYMGKSLTLAKTIGDRHGEMRSLNNLAMVYRAKGLSRQAATLYEAAVILAKQLGDSVVYLQILQNLGNTYLALQDYRQGIECFDTFLALSGSGRQGSIDNHTLRRVLQQLTTASLEIGDYPNAIKYLKRHLILAQKFGDTSGQAAIMADLKAVYRATLQKPQNT
jgi:tetratricopeptide (TPR) repeat protein